MRVQLYLSPASGSTARYPLQLGRLEQCNLCSCVHYETSSLSNAVKTGFYPEKLFYHSLDYTYQIVANTGANTNERYLLIRDCSL